MSRSLSLVARRKCRKILWTPTRRLQSSVGCEFEELTYRKQQDTGDATRVDAHIEVDVVIKEE